MPPHERKAAVKNAKLWDLGRPKPKGEVVLYDTGDGSGPRVSRCSSGGSRDEEPVGGRSAQWTGSPPHRIRPSLAGEVHALKNMWSVMLGPDALYEERRCGLCQGFIQRRVRLDCGHECCAGCVEILDDIGANDSACTSCPSSLRGLQATLKKVAVLYLRAEHALPSEKERLSEEAGGLLFSATAGAHAGNTTSALHCLEGLVLRQRGDPAGAHALFLKAIEAAPKLPHAHYNLGTLLYDDIGDVKGATQAYRRAIEADPNFVRAYTKLGKALHNRGDVDGAINAFNAAHRKDPTQISALHSIGALRMATGDAHEATQLFRQVVETTWSDLVKCKKTQQKLTDTVSLPTIRKMQSSTPRTATAPQQGDFADRPVRRDWAA